MLRDEYKYINAKIIDEFSRVKLSYPEWKG